MPDQALILTAALILLAALLYSSVGHGGASGYLAAMALMGVAPAVMKPSALTLNVLVATIGLIQFSRVGCFSWRLFWPFAVTSVPAAFLGGAITLQPEHYKPAVGAILLFAGARTLFIASRAPGQVRPPPRWAALLSGAAIGLLSGLTGTGGGIFLSPLLLFARWADTRQISGVAAAFILVNSIAGLVGIVFGEGSDNAAAKLHELTHLVPWSWAAAAVIGGLIGSYYGSRRLSNPWLRRLLSVVLLIAGLKLLFSL